MAVSEAKERHHAAPRCLLRDEAEFEHECQRWGVSVEIGREDLAALIERSTVVMARDKHRILHASDWQRWGRRGGMATLRR